MKIYKQFGNIKKRWGDQMEHVQIKVANRVGEHVGSFDQNGFEK